jgi:cyclic pyranopterin monophosphate synthase
MFSTVDKRMTLRRAKAVATLEVTPELVEILRSRSGPKGDALEIARAAGVMAAKKTPELIPYCHPLPIDQVTIEYTLRASAVDLVAEVTTIWKTGVEMEALVAVQMAATTLFDMLKPLDQPMSIEGVRVLEKSGGKSSFRERIADDFRAAIIVTSDGTARGTRQDNSGRIIAAYLKTLGIEPCAYTILPDEEEEIREALRRLVAEEVDLIVTTGGTGLGPRDVTVEATAAIIEREVPGVMETARAHGQRRTPYAMLSRGLAGIAGRTIILNLPGSSRGTEESLQAVFPAILHSYKMMAGGGH